MKSDQERSESSMSARERAQLLAGAAVVRNALAGSRSNRLSNLFEYLLDTTLAGEFPSEQQIVANAFVGDAAQSMQDANVRVYIHRLRKLLDSAFDETDVARLEIPVGEYRLRVAGLDAVKAPRMVGDASSSAISRKAFRWQRIVPVALTVLAALLLGFWFLIRDTAPLGNTTAWQPVADSGRPLTVVMGDYYMFNRLDSLGISPELGPQLVWDRSVPTREDLTILQMMNPAETKNLVDYKQQFVTGGTIEALSTVRGAIARLPGAARRPVKLVPSSQLTPELLASTDIVYIGQLSGMGSLLRDPLEQASRFHFAEGLDGMTDADGKERFQADNMVLTDERVPRRDFAYLASVPGPADNRILIIAGLGDAGVKQAAEIVLDPRQLDRLGTEQSGGSVAFEALYRVRTISNINVGATLIVNRPLRTTAIWDSSDDMPVYRPIKISSTEGARR